MVLPEAPNDATEPPADDSIWRLNKHLKRSGHKEGHYLIHFEVREGQPSEGLYQSLSFRHWSPTYGEDEYRAINITDPDDMMRQITVLTEARDLSSETAESARTMIDYVFKFQGRVSLK